MKHIIYAFCVTFLTVLFTTSCENSNDNSVFDYNLRGTWISNDGTVYSGTLLIEYNRITIIGYKESQTPLLGDDDKRPFKDFTKGIPLSGYSEDHKIIIKDVGMWQDGIPYDYYTGSNSRDKFLRFNFGGRMETLQYSK